VFASNYPWGWAPFHYGNWVYADAGWCWVPGRVWAPAWVDWRYGNGYVGWYPLPPVGYAGVTVVHQPVYTYVPVHSFTSANVGMHAVTPVQAAQIHSQTHPVTSAGYVGGHAVVPVNAGPPVTGVSAAVGHPITAVPVHQVSASAPVLPPQNQAGVHYGAGASVAHPVVTAPAPVVRPGATSSGARPPGVGTQISPASPAGSGTAAGAHPVAPVSGGAGQVSPAGGATPVAPMHGKGDHDHESPMGAAHEAEPMHGGGNPHVIAPAAAAGSVGHAPGGGGNSRPGVPPGQSGGGHPGGGGSERPSAPGGAPSHSGPATPPAKESKMIPPGAKPAHPVAPAPKKPDHPEHPSK